MKTKGGAKRTEKIKNTNGRTKGRRRRPPLLFQILFIKHVLFPAFGDGLCDKVMLYFG